MKLIPVFLFLSTISFAQKLKPVSVYLANPKLSKQAKSFYKNLSKYKNDMSTYYNDIKTEAITNSVMDSVLGSNRELRPFYLYLMNRHVTMSDGELYSIAMNKQVNILEKEPADRKSVV